MLLVYKLFIELLISVCNTITYIWRKGPVDTGGGKTRYKLYIILMEEGTCIAWAECEDSAIYNIYIYIVEEGTRIARAECEDGAVIYIYWHLYKRLRMNVHVCVICVYIL